MGTGPNDPLQKAAQTLVDTLTQLLVAGYTLSDPLISAWRTRGAKQPTMPQASQRPELLVAGYTLSDPSFPVAKPSTPATTSPPPLPKSSPKPSRK